MREFIKKYNFHIKVIGMFLIMVSIVCAFFYPLMPSLLNYPPNTYGNDFQWELEQANYTLQYIQIASAIILIYTFIVCIKLSFLKDFMKAREQHNIAKLQIMKEKLFVIPNQIYLLQIVIPSICVPLLYVFSTKSISITTLKIFVLFFSFITIIATFSMIYIRSAFTKLLTNLNLETTSFSKKDSIRTRIFYQVIPLFIVAILFTALVGYSSVIKEKSNTTFKAYHTLLRNLIITNPLQSEEELLNVMSRMEFFSSQDRAFILKPDGKFYNVENKEIKFSAFWNKYLKEFCKSTEDVIYDYYGVDTRGAMLYTQINGQTYGIGVQYSLTSYNSLFYFGLTFIVLLLLNIVSLRYFSTLIADDLSAVSGNLLNIVDNQNIENSTDLPVTSNDEIGKLIIAFNQIQKLTKENIIEIRESQETLMEKERLASLGQLIGGIAHNLKTPIMSISGASEGLTELIGEYIASISNPTVTPEDHKEIAKDMLNWVTKIKTHTSYMSDIISAVKGQAVNLSTTEEDSFTLFDLIKRIDILMKHEVKQALVNLNVLMQADPAIILHGDINSLVQVLNNLISNSIYSYNGVPNKTIDFIITRKENHIVFTIADTGCGMSEEVKEKLFKEMVTTKGKHGTGLGLYMSYSTIRGKFGGNITFTSEENKGTTFVVTIPIS